MIKINISTNLKKQQPTVCIHHQKSLSSNLIEKSSQVEQIVQAFDSKTNTALYQTTVDHEQLFHIFNLQKKIGLDSEDQIRHTAFVVGEHFKNTHEKSITIALDTWTVEQINAFIQGLHYASYQFSKYKSKQEIKFILVQIVVNKNNKINTDLILSQNAILFDGISLCRDWINIPGSDLTPEIFAEEAQKACKGSSVKIKVRKMTKLQKENFNGLVAVGKGSPNSPCLVTLSYQGAKAKETPHVALVGKGVTFDTGGISLKPGDSMWEMKSDMSGAATVLATILTVAKLELPINLSVILCLAENRPNGQAILPGDIFTAKNGKTIMVDNTDAEGRLVLSDGLAEAGLIGATHIIDLATLTGSIVRAIGPSMAGLFSNDDTFSSQIQDSGKAVSEKFWKMPLEMEYQEQLLDPVADFKNIGSINGGSITAALFLNEFVPEKTKWAHIDIAGTAFTTNKWKYYHSGLSTGWGLRSLVHLLSSDSFS